MSTIIYKQDIDDNRPMTGDETDTEDAHFKYVTSPTLANDAAALSDSSLQRESSIDIAEEMNGMQSGGTAGGYNDKEMLTESFMTPRLMEDESESLSSDFNLYSDEETSSIAGSFDEFGKDDFEDDSATSEPQSTVSREEMMRRKALKKHLDQLGDLVVEKEFAVQQAREELAKCQNHLKGLEDELETVEKEIRDADNNNQKATYFRLKSKKERLVAEIKVEKEVEERAIQNVDTAELHLAQTYIEHAKFIPFDDMLESDDKQSESLKADKASARIRKEMTNAMMLERRKKRTEKEHMSTIRERERRNRQAIIASKKNREVAMRNLKTTMSKVRQRESEEEDRSRSDLNQRMSALLSLKKNIEMSKENISAVQARDTYKKKQEDTKEKDERQKLLLMGENPDEVVTRRKRIRQFERDKEAFERKQREREIEIVNKIVTEEKQMKRRYQQQPQLWPENRPRRMPRKRSKPRFAPSSGSESMEYGGDVEDVGGKISYLHKFSTDEEAEFSPYGATTRDDERTTDENDNSLDEIEIHDQDDMEENLAQPEFKALWESSANQRMASEKMAAWKSGPHKYSKYEQEMMKTALAKQRLNVVQQQIAAGREFKGPAFYSKPRIVVFKDFDIGKAYKKKILLTNVSYSQSSCKFVGISDNLKDFLEINFTPPGALSAGLTCDLYATFSPMINEDFEGSIDMLSSSGIFHIPVKCLKKRCQIEVDTREVCFENTVAGETVKKSITVRNTGALSTEFSFEKAVHDEDDTMNEEVQEVSLDNHNLNEHVNSGTILQIAAPRVISTNDNDNNDDEEDEENIMRIGKVNTGTVPAFSFVQLDVIFSPIKASSVTNNFCIKFSDETLSDIYIKAKGTAIDLPIWVEREVIDLRICMFDRLYQDAIVVSNRATAALRIRFEIPKEFRNHLDILPRTAYVQAESQFSAQLKFLPRKTLTNDATSFIKDPDGVVEIPITIIVADQTQPVPFVVKARVTSSDFEFASDEINFGHCSVYETVHHSIQLSNKSVLPQQYGFVNLPETIQIQPNDGFGTILPHENIDLHVYFSPDKAQEYRFNLACKSHIGREFILRCRAVGVLPPMKLSHSLIQFKATAVNDISSANFFVINDHTSTNQFTHPVPRVGTGDIFPVGPTSFHFVVPEGAPLSFSPAIGTINAGEKCLVHVTFAPKLDPNLLESKASELEQADLQSRSFVSDASKPEAVESTKELKAKVNGGGGGTRPKGQKGVTPQPSTVIKQKTQINSQAKQVYINKASIALQHSFHNVFSIYKIPCFLVQGECGSLDTDQYNIHNTLYLEVHCPSVKPSLIVASENGDNLVDFGKVPMAQRHTQVISMQNISDKTVKLTSSLLDPIGPFEMVNALRNLEPKAIHSFKISFTPTDNTKFYEVLKIYTMDTTVEVRLVGQGVRPQLALEPSDQYLDVGDALVNDTMHQTLKVTNISELSVVFDLKMGSLISDKHNRVQTMPQFLHWSTPQQQGTCFHSDDEIEVYDENGGVVVTKHIDGDNEFRIGPPNKSGICVFGCEPMHGTMEPGESKEIIISFSPDHLSQLFRDELIFDVNGVREFLKLHLVGRSWPSITYVKGFDRLSPEEETLMSNTCSMEREKEQEKSSTKTGLLTMFSCLDDSTFSTSEHSIEIGCIKSNIQTRKSCDFTFENTKEAFEKGFSIEPMKGGVDIGAKKIITFRWTPPANFDPREMLKLAVQLVIRGDTTTTYQILLRGCIRTNLQKIKQKDL
ncbi:cilia- and flagella-associated protein 74-like isoform X2 [Clytia hemisphaerica]|uniref:Uncharacterized protein n=1 Tax=Clytia hemisphaerica TaxID=252671 RepID=A0A7M5X5Z8_9CNID